PLLSLVRMALRKSVVATMTTVNQIRRTLGLIVSPVMLVSSVQSLRSCIEVVTGLFPFQVLNALFTSDTAHSMREAGGGRQQRGRTRCLWLVNHRRLVGLLTGCVPVPMKE